MTVMFEVYYRPPADPARESALTALAERYGGRLDYREDPGPLSGVCLTFEFVDRPSAESAATALRGRGEHVEGGEDRLPRLGRHAGLPVEDARDRRGGDPRLVGEVRQAGAHGGERKGHRASSSWVVRMQG